MPCTAAAASAEPLALPLPPHRYEGATVAAQGFEAARDAVVSSSFTAEAYAAATEWIGWWSTSSAAQEAAEGAPPPEAEAIARSPEVPAPPAEAAPSADAPPPTAAIVVE